MIFIYINQVVVVNPVKKQFAKRRNLYMLSPCMKTELILYK